MKYYSIHTLIKNILAKKCYRTTDIYSSFLLIPKHYLNSDDKILLQVFMMLADSASIIENYLLQIDREELANLTGMSVDQLGRCLRKLPKKLERLNRSGFLTGGEKIHFKIKDDTGKVLPMNERGEVINTTGKISYFSFEYITPNLRKGFEAVTNKNKEAIEVPEALAVEASVNPDTRAKGHELERLKDIFTEEQLKEFLKYELKFIAKQIDYYFHSLKIKRIKEPDHPPFDLSWLQKCFAGNWAKNMPIHPADKIIEFVHDTNKLRDKCIKLIEKNKIENTLSLNGEDHGPPKFKHTDFHSLKQLQTTLIKEWEGCAPELQKQVRGIIDVLYKEHLKEKYFNGSDPQWARTQIGHALISKHLNLL